MASINTTPDTNFFYHVITNGRAFSTDIFGVAQFEFADQQDLGNSPKLFTTKEL